MSKQNLLTYAIILATSICTLATQLILKRATGELKPLLTQGPFQFLLGAASHPAVYVALVLQVAAYVAWLFVLTRTQLSLAVALSGSSFYLMMGLASWLFFGEHLSLAQWLGLSLISFGVILLTSTPA